MKPVSIYKPVSVEQAIQILSLHGTEAGVYAGGTDLLIRLKNRLKQAPTYLVDIKKIENLRYIKEDGQGGVQIGALTKLAEVGAAQRVDGRRRHPAGSLVPVSARRLLVLSQRRLHLLRRHRRQQLLSLRDGWAPVLCRLPRRHRDRAHPV
jgi:hypothetical protein